MTEISNIEIATLFNENNNIHQRLALKDVCTYNCAMSPALSREKVMFQLRKILNTLKAEILRTKDFFNNIRILNFFIEP